MDNPQPRLEGSPQPILVGIPQPRVSTINKSNNYLVGIPQPRDDTIIKENNNTKKLYKLGEFFTTKRKSSKYILKGFLQPRALAKKFFLTSYNMVGIYRQSSRDNIHKPKR